MANHNIVDTAKAFANEYMAPRAAAWEAERTQPVDAFKEAAKRGLLSFETPVAHGGMGANFATKLAICEVMSQTDMAFTFAMINTQNIAAKLANDGGDNRQHQIDALMDGAVFGATALSEPGAGSDFAGIKTTAVKTDNGWMLNGTKGWITNAAIADLFVVYAQTDPAAGWRGIASFLVDATRPGFKRGDIYNVMGAHAIGAGEFHLRNYIVPDADLLSPPGEGFKSALGLVNGARVYVAGMCCGMIQGALDQAVAYGQDRQAFGQPILNNQGLAWSLVEVATQLEALRALTHKAGDAIDNNDNPVVIAAMAKKFAGDTTLPAITACMQAMGANGLKQEHGLNRFIAGARVAAYADGSTEMMNERIAASLRSQ